METNRCVLGKLELSDYDDVRMLYTNEKVRTYLGGAIPDEYTLNKFMDALERSKTDSISWTVRLKNNNKFIGLVSLDKHIDGVYTEVSYEFLPNFWGHGYANEVVNSVLNYAFKKLHIAKIIAETQTANLSSCRLLERLGMKLERIIQRYGAEQAIYSIEKKDMR